jgi:hypothetical protein
MAQPQWITPVGSLGVIPEGIYYKIPIQASAGDQNVYFRLISGELPAGIQVTSNGFIEGIPRNIVDVKGVPSEVSADVTSKFAIRAYTQKVVNGSIVLDRLNDRTFTITVSGQDIPEFVTPAGQIAQYYDGSEVAVQIEFTDSDLNDDITIGVLAGELPPGLAINPRTGIISGIIQPLTGPPGTATPGFDSTPFGEYAFDFSTRSTSKNYQFTLAITDGKNKNIRTFEIFVYSKDSMSADTTDFTSDNTFITADVVPTRTPMLIAPLIRDLGRVRADNYYAVQFQSIDFDGDPVEYTITIGNGVGFDSAIVNGDPGSFDYDDGGFDRGTLALPPGLVIDQYTGWFYGYIPDQGATESTYRFAIRVFKKDNPSITSGLYYYTITIAGDTDTQVTWLTDPDLGTINNGDTSMLGVSAVNAGNRELQYRIVSGSDSKLPQGLSLLPSGNIVGRVSFNTFAIDGGTTTFDVAPTTRLISAPTTFDMKFSFDVNAYSPTTEQQGFEVLALNITNGGSGYVSQPTVTISAPPSVAGAIQATAGVVTITGGVITNIQLGNPGRGYTAPPSVTVTGGGGVGCTVVAGIIQTDLVNSVSVVRRFTITVDRAYNEPYESLYVKCMPPQQDRNIISSILQNQGIFSQDLLYRPDDSNFGVAKNVSYVHAYGLSTATLDTYVTSLQLNHYPKQLTLGNIKTAQALDSSGNVVYEVVYSEIIDDLVNNQGVSVGKEVTLAYPVTDPLDGSTEITTVYPNSLDNMRNQVIDTVGLVGRILPMWMTSRQANNQVLGYVPAWVIAYVKPGQSGRVKYQYEQTYGDILNIIDYDVDRYELDRSQTHLYNPATQHWIPTPPQATTFDRSTKETVFDGGATDFNAPADRWTNTDAYDKYLVFPKTNILG